MRRVQQILSSAAELNGADKQQPSEPSAIALKDKRLTFTWLDGEAQKVYLFIFLFYQACYDASIKLYFGLIYLALVHNTYANHACDAMFWGYSA